MRTRFAIILSLFAFIGSGIAASECPAQAPEGERPTWESGDFWIYEGKVEGQTRCTTEQLKVFGHKPYREKDVYVMQSGPLESYYDQDLNYLATFAGENEVASIEPAVAFFHWPLYVGKRWEQKAQYRNLRRGDDHPRTIESVFEVQAYEPLKVLAGTFQAFRLKRTGRADAGYDEYWYAPEVKNIVKRISLSPSGERTVTFELEGYTGHPAKERG